MTKRFSDGNKPFSDEAIQAMVECQGKPDCDQLEPCIPCRIPDYTCCRLETQKSLATEVKQLRAGNARMKKKIKQQKAVIAGYERI